MPQVLKPSLGTVYDGNDNDDDCDLPSIEQLLYTTLQKEGFATEDQRPKNSVFEVGDAAVERGGSLDNDNGSAVGDNPDGSLEDPTMLLGGDDSSASKAKVDDGGLRAERVTADEDPLNSPETATDSTTPASPSNPDGWHDIDDSPETAQRLRLAEQESSPSDPMRPRTSSSRASSEPLHYNTSAAGQCTDHTRSEATMRSSARPRSEPLDHLPTNRSGVDEHELVRPALDPDIFEEEDREQPEDEDYDNIDDGMQPQQGVKEDVAAALITGKAGDTYLSSKRMKVQDSPTAINL